MDKQLYRSDNNRMFMGVCAGIGEYFNIDPAVVRLLFMFSASSMAVASLYIFLQLL